jgi:hypothetical protein
MKVGKGSKKKNTIKIQYKQLQDQKGERKGRKTENEGEKTMIRVSGGDL